MTRQEAFELAVNGIINQNDFGVLRGTCACLYFDPETGNRCAIGHLVSEDEAKRFYNLGYDRVGSIPRFELPEGIRDDYTFLSDLQTLHDNCAVYRKVPAFIETAIRFGRLRNLDVSFITERNQHVQA